MNINMNEPRNRTEIIYYLIHRMSRVEKRHFKLQNQVHGKEDKAFIKLFDLLNNMKVYDDDALEVFWETENVQHKGTCIAYLLSKVIEIMYSKGKQDTLYVKNLIEPHIKSFHVYYRIHLLKLAYKELDKAEKIANKYNYLVGLLRILKLKELVADITADSEDISEPISAVLEKLTKVSEKITHQLYLRELAEKVYNGNPSELNEVGKELLKYEKKYDELHPKDRINFNRILARFFHRKMNYERAFSFAILNLELWNDMPYLIQCEFYSYLVEWSNMIIAGTYIDIGIASKHHQKYKKLPQKYKEIFSKTSTNVKIYYYMVSHLFDVICILHSEKYYEIEGVNKEVKETLRQYSPAHLKQTHFYYVLSRIFYVNILAKYYTESEYWLNQILDSSLPIIPRILEEIQICKLLINYEQNNQSLLISSIKSLERKWKISPPSSPNVLHVLKLLKKIQLKSNESNLPKLFEATYEEALQIEKNTNNRMPFSKWIAQQM